MNVNDLNAQEKAQYKAVAEELRCLVCQNQSIAESHASLATDLKEKIAEQVHAGKSKSEIKSYMQDRYGEFILYKPALTANNAVLWAGPFVVLFLAFVFARKLIKNSQNRVASVHSNKATGDWAEKRYQEEKKNHDK
jgi:cytochrome c-type biogenesis protein CcmH